jgi:hypothetical protein
VCILGVSVQGKNARSNKDNDKGEHETKKLSKKRVATNQHLSDEAVPEQHLSKGQKTRRLSSGKYATTTEINNLSSKVSHPQIQKIYLSR